MQAIRLVRYLLSARGAAFAGAAVLALSLPAQQMPEGRRLRTIAAESGLYLGSTLQSDYAEFSPAEYDLYTTVIGREFNVLSIGNEMKMKNIQPTEGGFAAGFVIPDAAADFAVSKNADMHFHYLVGGPSKTLPQWIKDLADDPNTTPAIFRTKMKTHISTVMNHWPASNRGTAPTNNRMRIWEVTNEMFRQPITTPIVNGNWRAGMLPAGTADDEDAFRKGIGTSYLVEALREAALYTTAGDILMYNDNNNEFLGSAENYKSDYVYAMVQDLLDPTRPGGAVPLDAVGFQCHMKDKVYDWSSLRANFDRFSELGVQLLITEMDWPLPVDASATPSERYDRQARNYHNFFDAALRSPGFEGGQVWGFTDKYTWLDKPGKPRGYPLLFDDNYVAKPSYYAIQDALEMQQRDQVIANADFEITPSAPNAAWTATEGAVLSAANSNFHSGVRALKVSGRTSSTASASQNITTALKNRGAGRYYFRAWCRLENGNSADLKLNLKLEDGSGVHYVTTAPTTVTDQWTLVDGWINVSWYKQLTAASVYPVSPGSSLTFFIDDIHLGDGNLLANPTLENNLTNWQAKGPATLQSTSATTGADTYHYGAKAARVVSRTAAWSGATQDVTAALSASGPGTYTLSGYLKFFPNSDPNADTGKLTLRVKTGGVNQYFAINGTIDSAKWTRLTNNVVVNWTGTLEEAELYLETPGSTVSFYLDDVILRRAK